VASLVVNTFPQSFLEVLHHSLQHGGRNCCRCFPDVLFQIHCCSWFLFVHLVLEISSEEEVLRLGTLVPINIEVPTKYPCWIVVFENRFHSKSPMLYRPALHGNWNALSLAGRALKEKFPTPTVPLTAVLQSSQVFLPDPIVRFLQWKPQQDATVYQTFIIPYFKWRSTCFGRHTAHHQEPKTAPAASGFAYVEGCRTCSCWTLSSSVRTLLDNYLLVLLNESKTGMNWLYIKNITYLSRGTRCRSWLRHCATSRKVAGSIPNSVIVFLHWHNPSGRIMGLGSTQPLTEMSTRNISWG